MLYDFQKNFSRGKHRNTEAFKVSFVAGNNIIAMYRFGKRSGFTGFLLRVIKTSSLVINARYFLKVVFNSVAVTTMDKSSCYLSKFYYMRF